MGLGHFLLPPLHGENCIECRLPQEKVTLKSAALKAWKRFRRRLPKLVMFTIPVYVAMYLMQHYGLFRTAEAWLSDHTPWLGVHPARGARHRAPEPRRRNRRLPVRRGSRPA